MPITRFPDPRRTDEDGILAIGGDLHPQSLLLAYRQGIFPWPINDPDEGEDILAWFCPPHRAVLDFDRLHVPTSLAKTARKRPFELTVNRDFGAVIAACAEAPRPGQAGTWINSAMLSAYRELHRLGYAMSVEAWAAGALVGGIYGVLVDGFFAGESMFHRAPNASKLALLHLIGELKARGISWMDIQVMTPHMEALGARNIARDEFLARLGGGKSRPR